jgi:hypothetical protein
MRLGSPIGAVAAPAAGLVPPFGAAAVAPPAMGAGLGRAAPFVGCAAREVFVSGFDTGALRVVARGVVVLRGDVVRRDGVVARGVVARGVVARDSAVARDGVVARDGAVARDGLCGAGAARGAPRPSAPASVDALPRPRVGVAPVA